MGQMRMLASLHLSISSSCTALATTTHNNKYLAPWVLALALAEWMEGNKGLCREITSDDASKKTSPLLEVFSISTCKERRTIKQDHVIKKEEFKEQIRTRLMFEASWSTEDSTTSFWTLLVVTLLALT
jgi:hypothetical protein